MTQEFQTMKFIKKKCVQTQHGSTSSFIFKTRQILHHQHCVNDESQAYPALPCRNESTYIVVARPNHDTSVQVYYT